MNQEISRHKKLAISQKKPIYKKNRIGRHGLSYSIIEHKNKVGPNLVRLHRPSRFTRCSKSKRSSPALLGLTVRLDTGIRQAATLSKLK